MTLPDAYRARLPRSVLTGPHLTACLRSAAAWASCLLDRTAICRCWRNCSTRAWSSVSLNRASSSCCPSSCRRLGQTGDGVTAPREPTERHWTDGQDTESRQPQQTGLPHHQKSLGFRSLGVSLRYSRGSTWLPLWILVTFFRMFKRERLYTYGATWIREVHLNHFSNPLMKLLLSSHIQ